MSKSKWWGAFWLGVLVSSGALASEAVSDPTSMTVASAGHQGAESVGYMGATTSATPSLTNSSQRPADQRYQSGIGAGASPVTFILAGLGALAVTAMRRRTR